LTNSYLGVAALILALNRLIYSKKGIKKEPN